MGTFDTYSAVVACPQCGDRHWISGQTKFFYPFGSSNSFEPGSACTVDAEPADIESLASGDYWRLRDRVGGNEHFTLLADLDEHFTCDCGMALAILLHFDVGTNTATMTRIELLDARTDLAAHIDFVEVSPLWGGAHDEYRVDFAKLAASPLAERAAFLVRYFADWFTPTTDAKPYTELIGPMQCDSCGEVRERRARTMLSHPDHHPFFAPAWTGGTIFLGDRVPFDDTWLADDVDRNWYFRARHPIGDTISLLNKHESLGCRCETGRASVLARFVRHPGELELVELVLRVVRSRADLAEVDFIEGPVRIYPAEQLSREQVFARITYET